MKIKNSQIVTFMNRIVDIQQKHLPVILGYAIAKNLKLMEPIAAAYEEERKKILDKYAEKDEAGEYMVEDKSYVIPDSISYEAEIQELLGIDNEIDMHMVPFAELEKCDSDQFDALSVQDICLLEIMTE